MVVIVVVVVVVVVLAIVVSPSMCIPLQVFGATMVDGRQHRGCVGQASILALADTQIVRPFDRELGRLPGEGPARHQLFAVGWSHPRLRSGLLALRHSACDVLCDRPLPLARRARISPRARPFLGRKGRQFALQVRGKLPGRLGRKRIPFRMLHGDALRLHGDGRHLAEAEGRQQGPQRATRCVVSGLRHPSIVMLDREVIYPHP